MESTVRRMRLQDCCPVAGVLDGVIHSRDGSVTVGWEMYPPGETTVTDKGYEDMVRSFASAFRGLPEWTVMHRQDRYVRREYRSGEAGSFLGSSYASHFDGRPYLEHRQFIFFTFNPSRTGRNAMFKPFGGLAPFGIRYRAPQSRDIGRKVQEFVSKASDFMAIVSSAEMPSRRLTTEDLEGSGTDGGLIQSYLMLGDGGPMTDDIYRDPRGTCVETRGRRLLAWSFARADDLPGEADTSMRVESLSSEGCDVTLSYCSPIGVCLDCEHVLNSYTVMLPQQEALSILDRRRRNMTAFSEDSAENTVNAEDLAEFIDMIHRDSKMCVYTHSNILAWDVPEREMQLRGMVGTALSRMGITAKMNTYDTPVLYWAGMPGGAMELGEDSWRLGELYESLCFSTYESFQRGLEGGSLSICDRRRLIPVPFDTLEVAYRDKLIENYNAFVLGPSGSGKSFFTNWYVRNCYDAGAHVFIIDKGDSYEGLCQVIREESRGSDGVYYKWSREHPFAFAPFAGCRGWKDDPESTGMSFLMSVIRIIWTPKDRGWDSENIPVLHAVISDFVASLPEDGGDPVFDDFLDFVAREISPRIMRKDAGAKGGGGTPTGSLDLLDREGLKAVIKEKGLSIRIKHRSDSWIRDEIRRETGWKGVSKAPHAEPYRVGGAMVTPEVFNPDGMCIALEPYSTRGQFGFLLNDREPADLFSSRFVVFEVDAISSLDATLYSLCTFCIINAFERKMRSGSDVFRLLFIEEAWQAIATEGTAEYLKALWKTARKFRTSATVVTQQVSDIMSSPVIRDAIISNSPVKILLDQRSNAASFDDMTRLLGLSPVDRALVRSVGRDLPPDARYREVFISLGGKRSGVFALEVSPEEAVTYESEKPKKRAVLERAAETGSLIQAIKEKTGR